MPKRPAAEAELAIAAGPQRAKHDYHAGSIPHHPVANCMTNDGGHCVVPWWPTEKVWVDGLWTGVIRPHTDTMDCSSVAAGAAPPSRRIHDIDMQDDDDDDLRVVHGGTVFVVCEF